MTWWITRGRDGGIAAAYQYQQEGLDLEVKADDDAELVAFLTPAPPPEPTKSELLAQINALMAKVEALPD